MMTVFPIGDRCQPTNLTEPLEIYVHVIARSPGIQALSGSHPELSSMETRFSVNLTIQKQDLDLALSFNQFRKKIAAFKNPTF
jgi:hypothetical protein